jgi:hypothetical protein
MPRIPGFPKKPQYPSVKAYLSELAKDIAELVVDSENIKQFREQLRIYNKLWTAWTISDEADRNGCWVPSMGRPEYPLNVFSRTYNLYYDPKKEIKRLPGFYSILSFIHDSQLPNLDKINNDIVSSEIAEKTLSAPRHMLEARSIDSRTHGEDVREIYLIEEYFNHVKIDLKEHCEKDVDKTELEEIAKTAQDQQVKTLSDIELFGCLTEKFKKRTIRVLEPDETWQSLDRSLKEYFDLAIHRLQLRGLTDNKVGLLRYQYKNLLHFARGINFKSFRGFPDSSIASSARKNASELAKEFKDFAKKVKDNLDSEKPAQDKSESTETEQDTKEQTEFCPTFRTDLPYRKNVKKRIDLLVIKAGCKSQLDVFYFLAGVCFNFAVESLKITRKLQEVKNSKELLDLRSGLLDNMCVIQELLKRLKNMPEILERWPKVPSSHCFLCYESSTLLAIAAFCGEIQLHFTAWLSKVTPFFDASKDVSFSEIVPASKWDEIDVNIESRMVLSNLKYEYEQIETEPDTKREREGKIVVRKPFYKKRCAKIIGILSGLVLITTLLINLKTIKEWFYSPRIQTSTSKRRQLPLTNENKLSVSLKEICKDIDSRPLAQRSDTAKQYVGIRIKEERLKLLDVSKNPEGDIYFLSMVFPDQSDKSYSTGRRIICDIPKEQHPELNLAKQGVELYISGQIKEAGAKYIELSDVSLKFD